MRIINLIDSSKFNYNGKVYSRVYTPLAQGNANIGVYNLFTGQQLIGTTHFSEYQINDVIHPNRNDALAALVDVLYNHELSGTGGTITNITEIPYRSYNDLQDLPTSTNVDVADNNPNLSQRVQIATVDGTPLYETVTRLNNPTLNGNIMTLKFVNEKAEEQEVFADLSTITVNSNGYTLATFNDTTKQIELVGNGGVVTELDLSGFYVESVTDPTSGITNIIQEGVTKLTVSKAGQSGSYNDLLDIPASGGTHTHTVSEISDFPTDLATHNYVATQIGAIDIPTNTSDLTNDSNYVTASQIEGTVDVATNLPLTAAHKGKTLICTGTIQITVPTGLGTNFTVNIINDGAGIVSVVASGTTLKAPFGQNLEPNDAGNILKKTSAETFYLQGEFSE